MSSQEKENDDIWVRNPRTVVSATLFLEALSSFMTREVDRHAICPKFQACLELIDGRPGGKAGVLAALDDIQRFKGGEANTQFLSHLKNNFAPASGGGVGVGRCVRVCVRAWIVLFQCANVFECGYGYQVMVPVRVLRAYLVAICEKESDCFAAVWILIGCKNGDMCSVSMRLSFVSFGGGMWNTVYSNVIVLCWCCVF